MDYTVITKLPNSEKIELALSRNMNYCPCKVQKTEDTKCMCKEFRELTDGECACGLYSKSRADYLLYTREGCPRCDIIKTELIANHKTFVESTDYPEDVVNLPVLVCPSGISYDFKSAMAIFPRKRGGFSNET